MAEVMVERNPARMDAADMAAVLKILDALALGGEPTGPDRSGPDDDWVLVLHWLQQGPVSSDTEAGLPGALTGIREHFSLVGKLPPARMEVLGPDGARLLTVAPGV